MPHPFPSIHHLPSPPSTPPSPFHLVRSHLFTPYSLQSPILCHHSYSQKKKRRNLFSKKVVKTWRVPVDVSTVAAVRGVSVLLPSLCRRRVLCVQTHVPTPPLFSSPPFLVHGAVLTGTATFFFFHTLLYIDRAQSKLLSNHVVCIVSECAGVDKQSDTRLQTARRRGHPLGKNLPFSLRSDDPIR
jgi:hypothetical protein